MSRAKKMLDLAMAKKLLEKSETIVSKSNYNPNKVVHVLEDVQIQYPQLVTLPETSDDGGNKVYYDMNDDINNISLIDLSNSVITESLNTIYVPYPTSPVYNVDNTTTNDNLIIIPSQIDIVSESTNTLVSNYNNSDNYQKDTIQASEALCYEQNQCSLLTISNTPDYCFSQSMPSQIEYFHTSSVDNIPLVDTSHLVPNPPISDESDTDKKLVPYSDSDTDSLSKIKKSSKRKKRFEVNKKEWISEKNKERRESGKSYYGRERKGDCWTYDLPKEARSIKPRCTCKISKYSTLKCETIDEDSRKEIFKQFWSFTWGEKKTLVNEWVTTIDTVRPRNRNTKETTKRANTFVYHLKVNNVRVKVCRKMFLNTLDLGRWTVQNWKKNFSLQPPSTMRRHNQSSELVVPQRKKSLIEFLNSLPVMESHYCRATSQKLYLLPEWKSKESLYKFYVDDWCKERNIEALSISMFSNIFEGKNFSLFRPKKDQCEKCACYKVGAVTEEQHKEHIEKVKQAREEKAKDKEGEDYVFTVDLQAVLMAPKSNVSTLYYKTKLQVHNLCFFNLKNKDGYCFLWNEVEGGLNAEEFASIWVDFLENQVISENIAAHENKTIIIYSDGCTYQNRNCILSNALLNIVLKHKNITIEQKYLEVGHTQMEADSMYSTIERHLKNKIINVPAEYISIAKRARKCPAPYIVKYLDHTYFKKFDKIQFYKSIRPGRSKGDPKVTDIRALRYESNGSILYKTWYNDDWQPLPQRRSLRLVPCETNDLTKLHQNRRKITLRKFQDLQEIKKTLPSDYHKYYDDLPHD
ncbi:uncharacterized protein LOC132904096 [Amyelois transitella]|uniref:uncharacterized protein LOC132904096 n=1 Tax=Amyelois transitella TaxID=680683 RepID=UPI00298FC3CD|nr:uncharacterized protein LOC132904096 [Amyelois transitella]